MDLVEIVSACAEGLAFGGFEALGYTLATQTKELLKGFFANIGRKQTDQITEEAAKSAFSNPEAFAKQLEQAAQHDDAFRTELDNWIAEARRSPAISSIQSKSDINARNISNSNIISGVAGNNIHISQS